ncbi:MAG: hypothetical protein ACREQV_09110, partial [Candidatus Binatia bacterium]
MISTARYAVRAMTAADVEQVMEIEQQSFPANWPQTAYQRELTRNRLARYFVAVDRLGGSLGEPHLMRGGR